jgi:hypothetical protein
MVQLANVGWRGGCNIKRAFKNNIKNEVYVAGNGVEALDMLHRY